jgi:hypothetical protein
MNVCRANSFLQNEMLPNIVCRIYPRLMKELKTETELLILDSVKGFRKIVI